MVTFEEIVQDSDILRAVQHMGFEQATPIQEKTIPAATEGKDLIGQAQTGTGKTAAFGIPLIGKINTDDKNVQGIVLTPTRELAVQVAEELNKLARYKGIRALPIYGGQDIGRQIKALKRRPQIIVATPGRFMDHMRRRTIRLDMIKSVVLDEADEMLSMGFIEDIEYILKEVPEERQTLLFSATMPKRLQIIAEKFMKDPTVIRVKTKAMTVDNIEQRYLEVPEKQKFDTLCRLFDIHTPELAIVFGRTKRRVDELAEALNLRGYDVEGIHGDLRQGQRDKVLGKFKTGNIEILVATDVAARGLDISGVTHVFNFDLPQDPESYVHRIGRTGRAGNKGLAFTFVTPHEMEHLKAIEATTKSKVEREAIPSFAQANEGRQRQSAEKVLEIVESNDYSAYQALAENMLNEHDAVTLLSAALKMVTKEPSNAPVRLTSEAPLATKKNRRGHKSKRFSGKKPHNRRGDGKNRNWKKPRRKQHDSRPKQKRY